jgi:hypothetical protein
LTQILFSNADYFLNSKFIECLRNWNKYLNSDESSIELLYEWEEVLLKDFLKYSREWLKHNYNNDEWKEKLE